MTCISALNKKGRIMTNRTNPRDEITIENFSNQALGACFRPYNAFLNFETYPKSCETLGGVPYKLFHEDIHSRRHF